jgi:hypothetical protein
MINILCTIAYEANVRIINVQVSKLYSCDELIQNLNHALSSYIESRLSCDALSSALVLQNFLDGHHCLKIQLNFELLGAI